MNELRWHPLLRQWVAVASHRQGRPQMPADWCPFCPGSGSVPDHYDVYLYPNDFPAFSLDSGPFDAEPAFYKTTGAQGVCDVVLYHTNHTLLPSQLSVEHWSKVIDLWTRRYKELAEMRQIRYVYTFENTGVAIGVTMPHPHGQIYAFPFVPPLIQTELDSARSSYDNQAECLYCRILREEEEDKRRIVARNGSFVAFIPFFARFPAEVQIYSRRHFGALGDMTETEKTDLADMLSIVRRKYDNLFGFPMPLIMALRQQPTRGEHPYFHFHIEFDPIQRSPTKLKYLAAVETAAGTFLNDTVAEERAADLRAAEPVTV